LTSPTDEVEDSMHGNNLTVTEWFFVELSDTAWFMIEMIPITMAIGAIIVCAFALGQKVTQHGKVFCSLAVICALLLIIAQGGWISAHLNDASWFKSLADNIWTIFNTLVMTTFILGSRIFK
jgi:hypothetical protein